ncbi:hypothetical protein [Halorhodospira halophila]|uniref:hypothetical protein n=1 Tax=Halorhodospira halophila TaxID=1053 RepID=UPI001913CFB7|nr:hypothetical protein [Halorhodospira halophila]
MSTKSRDNKSANDLKSKSLQGGSALIIGLVAIVAIGLLVAGLGRMVESRAVVTVQSLVDARAFYAAESSLISGRRYIELSDHVFGKTKDGRGNYCRSGEGAYIGKVGISGNSNATQVRHTICASIDFRKIAEQSSGWSVVEKLAGGNKKIENLYVPEEEKAQGGGNVEVEGAACLASGSSVTGNVTFKGDVYIQSGSPGDFFTGNAPSFDGCIYVDGKVADVEDEKHIAHGSDCSKEPGEPTGSGRWCGGLDSAGFPPLRSWDYARF